LCNQADTGDWVAGSVVKGEKGRSFRLFFCWIDRRPVQEVGQRTANSKLWRLAATVGSIY